MVGELGVLKIGQLGMGEMGDGCVDAFDGDITSSIDVDVGGVWECKERPCERDHGAIARYVAVLRRPCRGCS